MAYYYFALLLPRVHELRAAQQLDGGFAYGADLYPVWLTGRELFLKRMNPYAPEMTREIQQGLYGRVLDAAHPGDPPSTYRSFAYPLYADVLALPLLPLPFRTVQMLLTVVLPLLAGATLIVMMKAMGLAWSSQGLAIATLLCLLSYPVLEALYAQQPALVVGAALSGLALALVRKQLWQAGMLLAVTTIKPQMVILLVFWLLLWSISGWKNRRSLLIAFAISLGVLLTVSEQLLPHWWKEWWHVVAGYRQYTVPPLALLLLGKKLGLVAEGALFAIAALVGWRARRESAAGTRFWLTASVILTITVVTLPTGDAVYDQFALVLPVVLLFSNRADILNGSRPLRLLALFSIAVFIWQFAAATAVSLASLLAFGWSHSNAALLLPLRTASSLPLLILVLLLWLTLCSYIGERKATLILPGLDVGELSTR